MLKMPMMVFLIFYLIFVSYKMIIIHPHQNIYFNVLAGSNVNSNFEIDDKVLSINGVATKSWSDLVLFIQNNPNTDINVIVDRDDKIIEYTAKVLDKNGHGFLGISKKIDKSSFVIVT